MAITKTDGVVVEGEFHQRDQFDRCGVIRDDVFAVCDDRGALKQLKFSLSGLSAETTCTISASGSGALTVPSSLTATTSITATTFVAATTWAKVGSYTVATLPSASTAGAGAMIFVTDDVGGATLAYSDATDWRRVADRAVIAAS